VRQRMGIRVDTKTLGLSIRGSPCDNVVSIQRALNILDMAGVELRSVRAGWYSPTFSPTWVSVPLV